MWFKKRKAEKERQENWVLDQARITQLRKDLTDLGRFPHVDTKAYEFAVHFFQIVSDFQDKGNIRNAPTEISKEQTILNTHINNSGRREYGINRTKYGEMVTLDNTYWGEIFQLSTKTGRYWIDNPSAYPEFAERWLKNPSKYEANPSTCKVIADFQIKPFVQSHLPKMLELCDTLLATA